VQTEAPPSPPAAAPQATCPGCGKPVDTGDAFCLHCGHRIAQRYRRPPNWRIPVVLIALLVIAAGVAAGFGVTQLTNKDEGPETITVGPGLGDATRVDPGESPPAPAPTPAPAQPQPTTPAEPQPGGAAAWPKDQEAYTVVLLTTKSRQTADETAQKAAAGGLEAGVLKSDDFARFEPGLYVVFAGQYDNVDAASGKAQELSDDNPGAYARFIEPK
jgi:predicted nucleic acid-binding Zn ribbon protein